MAASRPWITMLLLEVITDSAFLCLQKSLKIKWLNEKFVFRVNLQRRLLWRVCIACRRTVICEICSKSSMCERCARRPCVKCTAEHGLRVTLNVNRIRLSVKLQSVSTLREGLKQQRQERRRQSFLLAACQVTARGSRVQK